MQSVNKSGNEYTITFIGLHANTDVEQLLGDVVRTNDGDPFRIFESQSGAGTNHAVAKESKGSVQLFSYQLMPNHYHLVLRPLADGEMSRFMGWVGGTHTMR